ncbi:MAG: cob(I)yrinic acid a,c-diamide adenosyltransferase [Patescibacteria group bacterium]|nr:cob(I)yrinic acid a,c-diamide adenosyltransferase [Patescibacteria group bacterium]MDE1944140.1 cob(I)yrinic acid a,c-diamide adenosyltransferase [Patescibacteria group bacterium]MDE1944761.1 cob(I)yrinic acid a,c-diamide adenosyltransferase [Patescibacteria group bacterium]MDE2058016.1 cob(I)yrinic acid a,c-diamide adenosyltransferase [Patescibacteria group bacterium]
MALFTGKGDGGTTKLFDSAAGEGGRIAKSSEVPEALGALDELNAFLGFVKMHPGAPERVCAGLRAAQETLFIVQAEVAGADKRVPEAAAEELAAVVNAIEGEIPPVTSFSVAGGTELSAKLDVARTVARRAERRVTAATLAGRSVSPGAKAYLNRLSSLLFAYARLANHLAGVAEEHPRY